MAIPPTGLGLPVSCEASSSARFLPRFGTVTKDADRGKMHNFIVFLFAIGAGVTASGLVASTYRLLAREPKTKIELVLHYAVMVIAGPVVVVSNSTKSYRDKECSMVSYALAIALSGYWAFVTGVVILSVWVAIRGA